MRDKQKRRKKETLHNNHVDKQKENEEREKNVYLIPTKLNLTDI